MKVLVLGASGQVGGALWEVLKKTGIDTCATYNSHQVPGAVPLDVRDPGAVLTLFSDFQPDTVFVALNTPGGVDECEKHPAEAKSLIVAGTRNILQASALTDALVIFYSSDYVFNGEAGPYSEEASRSPINAYGRAKVAAEDLVLEYPHPHLILRTTAVFSWNSASKNFAMTLSQRLSTGKPLRVPDDQWCNPTLAGNLAETSVRLVQMGTQGIVNTAGATHTTRTELARALAMTMGFDPGLIEPVATSDLGQRAARPLHAGLKTEKLAALLGAQPIGLQESLARFRRTRQDALVSGGDHCG